MVASWGFEAAIAEAKGQIFANLSEETGALQFARWTGAQGRGLTRDVPRVGDDLGELLKLIENGSHRKSAEFPTIVSKPAHRLAPQHPVHPTASHRAEQPDSPFGLKESCEPAKSLGSQFIPIRHQQRTSSSRPHATPFTDPRTPNRGQNRSLLDKEISGCTFATSCDDGNEKSIIYYNPNSPKHTPPPSRTHKPNFYLQTNHPLATRSARTWLDGVGSPGTPPRLASRVWHIIHRQRERGGKQGRTDRSHLSPETICMV